MPQRWCIVTCEYPPIAGGVSDHTWLLARALVDAGDSVDVWCPPADEMSPESDGVTVHVLPSRFGLDAIRVLRTMLRALPADVRVLVQWVPTGYGWRMLNVPFALMLYSLPGRRLDLYVHEVGWEVSSRETVKRAIAGAVHRVMTWMAVRSSRRVFVTIPEWGRRLHLLGVSALGRDRAPVWAPVASNLPDTPDPARVAGIRSALLKGTRRHVVVGHFGTFGRYHAGLLPHAVTRILDEGSDRVVLLIGRGGAPVRDLIVAARPDLAARLVATGGLAPDEVSAHIAACDLLVQPYEDGVSARRSSVMACLALGRPTITNRGWNTEGLWSEERAVQLTDSAAPHALSAAVTKLMADPALRQRIGESGLRVHGERFALARGIALLRALDEPLPAPTVEPTPVALPLEAV